MQELVEQERFEELARDGESAFARVDLEPWQRRELAFYALRGYHRVFAATGQPAGLCRARNLLRRVEREVGLGEDAAIAARLRDVTETDLARQGPKDPCGKPRPAAASAPPTTPAQLLPVQRKPAPPPAVDDGQPPLLAVSRTKPASAPATAPTRPTPDVPPAQPDPAPSPRNRILAGSLLLVAGLGLGAGTAVMLLRRSEANGEIVEIGETVSAQNRWPTDAELARANHLADVYRDLTPAAGVTGAVASIAAVTGVVLLAVPQRRRATARVSASPWSAMLTITGRF
ncbi:hypothetical protein POL25_03570 [Nannocystis sp. bb15-2]|uniref:Uncharacterized protein n=2 Tax=Nannocystis bainbridge TaxID=2995303 RepID=A0ABT5DQR9_9BACT|nr:hypothetical protein [Nannocystis bainbridge]